MMLAKAPKIPTIGLEKKRMIADGFLGSAGELLAFCAVMQFPEVAVRGKVPRMEAGTKAVSQRFVLH